MQVDVPQDRSTRLLRSRGYLRGESRRTGTRTVSFAAIVEDRMLIPCQTSEGSDKLPLTWASNKVTARMLATGMVDIDLTEDTLKAVKQVRLTLTQRKSILVG